MNKLAGLMLGVLLAVSACSPESTKTASPNEAASSKPDAAGSPATVASPGPTAAVSPKPGSLLPKKFPGPGASLPEGPKGIAEELVSVNRRLRQWIDLWRKEGGGGLRDKGAHQVSLGALRQQRIFRELVVREGLEKRVASLVGPSLRKIINDHVVAGRGLRSLVTPLERAGTLPVTRPDDPRLLLRLYQRAARMFDLDWEVLASLNFVESKFGRFMGPSSAGAMGPMQFMPATWDIYGDGGNIMDPRDAIKAAARYLSASGAPGDMRGALYAYNHSYAYVDAIQAYARHIRRDPRNFFAYYFWQVFVITTKGDVQLSGPGTGTP